MKRMFFYANFRTYDLTLGITRKVFSQIEAFESLGYDVTYCGYLSDGVAIFNSSGEIISSKKYPVKNSSIQHAIRRYMIMDLCIKYLRKQKDKYDFSYLRYHFFDKKYVSLLEELKNKSNTVIIEAHSAPKFSNKLSLMMLVGKRDAKWCVKAKNSVDIVASMSDEDTLWGIKTIKISNAIDLESVKKHNYNYINDDINFISVSYERDVHGYDRLINGISNYYKQGGNRNIFFHMVGTTLPSTERLIEKLGLKDRCILYGPLCGESLDEVYDKANIGVGCLANHRIGSFYGSALKTKEYIAKGIPFIYGWNEKILESFSYARKYDLCEDPIDIFDVISFYDSLDKTDIANKIRNCLGKEDTWEYQMGVVVNAVEGKVGALNDK